MVIGRSNIARELTNLCVEIKPLLRVLNKQGYDIAEVQYSRIHYGADRGPVLQLLSHGIWTYIELSMKIWEDVNNYFWRDRRRFERKPRFMFNWS